MRLDKQNIYGVGGKVMNVLEKILEEIEHEAMTNKEIGRKQCEGMARAMNIVSSHLNEFLNCEIGNNCHAVSYTHLTLPTTSRV